VSGDAEKLDVYMPLAVSRGASLITLTMNEDGVPQNVDTRVMIAAEICGKAMEHGMATDKLFIDPIVLPINCDQKQPRFLLEVFTQIQVMSDPPPHTTVGLSNVSQGTSQRSLIDRAFLTMAIAAGLDSAIMNVLDKEQMDTAITAEMILNKFIYGDSYLLAARKRQGT
jgi:5-methyltetrahydrofolate corrinoid/iron sulfur protein methyltransferase